MMRMAGMPSFLPSFSMARNLSTSGRTLPGLQYISSRIRYMCSPCDGAACSAVVYSIGLRCGGLLPCDAARSAKRRRGMDDPSADDCQQHFRVLELHRGDREQVTVDYDEVRELPRR